MMIKPTYVVSMAEIHDIHVACGVIILDGAPPRICKTRQGAMIDADGMPNITVGL